MECNKCKQEIEPNASQLKKRWYICMSCRHAYDKEWRMKRKELGFKTGGTASLEWTKEYIKEYYQRPEVKQRRIELARKYRSNPDNKIKTMARDILRNAIRNKILIKKPCAVCGDVKSEGHHENYYKPLEVEWLCSLHHKQKHNKLG